jgi:hypothetical protein
MAHPTVSLIIRAESIEPNLRALKALKFFEPGG